MSRMSQAVPSLRQLTPPASLLLVAAAGAWVGVVLVARHMGSMPGTMGLGAGSFAAVWALMMAAMMLPSVAPFASLYSRSFTGDRGSRLGAFASGYLIVWTLAALPAYGLAWLASRLAGGHPTAATVLAVAIFAACGTYQLTSFEGPVPGPLPLAARVSAQAWRLPGAHSRPAGGALPRRILPGLLLGTHGPADCLRVDERHRHGGPCRRRPCRKDVGSGRPLQPRPGCSRARPRDRCCLRTGPRAGLALRGQCWPDGWHVMAASGSSPVADWRVRGSYFEACNCEAICPCRSVGGRPGGPSSFGECFGALSWHIHDGHADGVDLSGLRAVISLRYFDRVRPSTRWEVVLYVDHDASDEQRAAIADIFLGRAGGTVARLYGPAIGEVHAVRPARITLDHIAARKRIDVVGYLTVEAEGDASQPGDVRCGIPGYDHPGTELHGDALQSTDPALRWEVKGRRNAAFTTDFDYRSGT